MRVLNLGAGVQSTAVYLLAADGLIDGIDAAIFADTQEEPKAVYSHVEWLRSLNGPRILVASVGKLGDDLLRGENSTRQRFASIPAYTTSVPHEGRDGPVPSCQLGMVRRQCTREYKIEVVERTIRRELLGLKFRQHMPKGTVVTQLFGISKDEERRAVRIRARIENLKWARPEFPLLELGWTRQRCKEYLRDRVPHEVPRSACVFCPYHKAQEWLDLKKNDPESWQRAVEVDAGLRRPGGVVNRGLEQSLYLHRSCLPLDLIDFEAEALRAKGKEADKFALMDCGEGMCGV